MSARTGRDPLVYVVAVAAVLVLALFVVPALGSDRMPPDAVCAAIALLAAGVALVAALAPGWLRALTGPAAWAAVAFTSLPVLAYVTVTAIAADDRVSDYHFSDRAIVTTVVAVHCLWALTWLAAVWSQDAGEARGRAADLWTLVVVVPIAATATMWLAGDFVTRVTGGEGELVIAYALAQPLAVLVTALRSRVGTVVRVLAPLSTIVIGLALNLALSLIALSQAVDD